jgi:RsiW-degrading membrane proteinase PrsW (M82 family)
MHLLALLLQNQPDPEMVRHVVMAMAAIIPIIILVAIALVMLPCWFILKKAGFTPWLSLLCIIPSLGTLVLLYVLAFTEWKVVPAPQPGWQQPPYPPQPPYSPPPTIPPQA